MLSTRNSDGRYAMPRMIGIILFLSAALALGGVLPVSAGPASFAPQADAIVRCDPSSVFGYTNETVAIDLYVQDVVALYGLDVIATFDTGIASVVDQNNSVAGVQIEALGAFLVPGYTLFQTADNSAGTIHYATAQLNPSVPATGSGPVARVVFQPKTYGEFTMTFTYHMLSDRNGVEIPSIAHTCAVKFSSPLAVQLADFAATSQAGAVLLRWETVWEADVVGFNVYRSAAEDAVTERVNPALIPSETPGGEGAAYSWTDTGVIAGETYTYWLEEIGQGGVTERHGPVSVTVEPMAPVLRPYKLCLPLLVVRR